MQISIELNSSTLERLKQFMADKLSTEEEYKIISEGAVDTV